jgi:isopropylmalate/homocitrate/citramalate synthase
MTQALGYREGMWAVSPYNFDAKVRAGMHLPAKVQLMDMTLREGRQVDGVSLCLEDVVEFARRIDAVGIPIIEMHHDDPEEIRQVKKLGLKVKVQALVHPTAALNPELCNHEIDLCTDVGSDIICLAFAISDYNYRLVESMGGMKITREQALDKACEAVHYGKRKKGALISVNLMDFSRLDLERLKTIASRLAEAGVDILRIDDICAPCLPAVYEYHAKQVKQMIGKIPLAIHSHNDFDLATAGQLSALQGGAEILEGCINGLGERAGVPNIAVLAAVLEIFYGYNMGIHLEAFQELSEFVADVWNQPIPVHLAGTGRTAFSHAAEVHYVLPEGDQWSFNAWAPKTLGSTDYVALCHYSGPMAIKRKAKQMNLGELSTAAANEVLAHVRKELRHRNAPLTDRLFTELVAQAAKAAAGSGASTGRAAGWARVLDTKK